MTTLRRLILFASTALAGMAFVTIAAAQANPARGASPAAQTNPAPAVPTQGRGAAPAQANAAAAPAARGPAPTLTKPATPTKLPDAQGFIPRWMLLEPIPFNSLTENAVRAGVKKEYFPNQFTVIPKDGDKVTVDGKELTWHAVDTKLYNVNLYHFAWALNKETSNVLFWTVTVVNCAQDAPNVRLAVGSNAASVWWVNGEEVASLFLDRQTVIDDARLQAHHAEEGPERSPRRGDQRRRSHGLLRSVPRWGRQAAEGVHGELIDAEQLSRSNGSTENPRPPGGGSATFR